MGIETECTAIIVGYGAGLDGISDMVRDLVIYETDYSTRIDAVCRDTRLVTFWCKGIHGYQSQGSYILLINSNNSLIIFLINRL